MIIEQQSRVEGVKNGQPFVSVGRVYQSLDKELAYWEARIADPPVHAWQPTILKVTVSERMCSEWAEIGKAELRDE